MAPPRLECLNSMRTICRKVPGLKASFSTSRSFRAGEQNISSPNSTSGNAQSTQRLSKIFNDSINMKNERIRRESMELAPRDSSYGESTTVPTTEEELKSHSLRSNLTRWITRRFKEGDVYSPHDLSWVEMSKWKRRGRPAQDAFDALDLNPLDHYRNFSMVSEYMTAMGRIKHSKETGLRPVNQRRIARTIRRAIGMGLTPSVHRHPEILQKIIAKKPFSLR
ncbi:hypothetical protein HYFRA_00001092 [Hymenoscyphus fraxineus]|uniref:Small ribosomal subunit protein bS18m n=1 Tax=Hymenoscyphus fraxineus TaxID=746836 RepID=A0A9N9KRT7_9HELO|nr:hypothetical protein HYFRA_00001092 [Hymenoscyphus fraxineus]